MALPITHNLLKIKFDGSIGAYATSFSQDFTWDTIEIAKLGSGGAKEFIVSDYSWAGSAEFWVLQDSTVATQEKSLKDLLTMAKNRQKVYFAYIPEVSANMYVDGSMYITGMNITGATGSAMTFSADFQGTGDFAIKTTV
jgi:hypothetical protein